MEHQRAEGTSRPGRCAGRARASRPGRCAGAQGPAGAAGAQGPRAGRPGRWASGPQGPAGPQGAAGPRGLKVRPARQGDTGATGLLVRPARQVRPAPRVRPARRSERRHGRARATRCARTPGVPGVVVTHNIDTDSGECGVDWANTDYTRTLQFIPQNDGKIQIVRTYRGTFTTIAGVPPPNPPGAIRPARASALHCRRVA